MSLALSTGTELLDRVIGKYNSEKVHTIYGPAATGKTTCSFLAAIECSRLGYKTLFLDTENGFNADRIRQLAGSDYEKALTNIMLLRIPSFSDQEAKIEMLSKHSPKNVKLIIVDTITSHYRVAVTENHETANKSLIDQLIKLHSIAKIHDLVVLLTSQVYSSVENKGKISPTSGGIITKFSHYLLELDKDGFGKRHATLIQPKDSPNAGKSFGYMIKEQGIYLFDS